MPNAKQDKSAVDRTAPSPRAAALIVLVAVLAFVAIAVEAPRLLVGPDEAAAMMAAGIAGVDGPLPAADTQTPDQATVPGPQALHASVADYFPSHFRAPRGDPDLPVPTF